MTTFFTADTHFGHANAYGGIVAMCNRPFASVADMDAALIDNWNARVTSGDTVYILGDFAWRNHNHYIMALNGKKILVCGNHDKMSVDCRRNFTKVYGNPPGGMAAVTIDGVYAILSHYPQRTWNGRCHDSLSLYGHVHARMNTARLVNTLDVGVDNPYAKFAPLTFGEILELNKTLPYVNSSAAAVHDAAFIDQELETL